MANYTRSTNFTAKDALSTGDPAKTVLGAEHQTEYDAIALAIGTKLDDISTLSAEASPDYAADYLPLYDASASSPKKVLVDNIRKSVFEKTRLSMFRASSGSTTSLPSGATTVINLNSESYDIGSNFSANTYTAPYTGMYVIMATSYITGTPSALCTLTSYIRVNAGDYYIGVAAAPGLSSTAWSFSGSILVTLNAGDTVKLTFTHNAGVTMQAEAGSSNTLAGYFIREAT